MKRILVAILFLSLAIAGSLPQDTRYDQPVSVQTGVSGMPLEQVLDSLARSVGLTAILREVPKITVNLDLEKKPFRQIWDLLIKTFGDGKLDYQLMENNVILVAPSSIVAQFQQAPKAAPTAEPDVRKFYGLQSGDAEKIADFLRKEFPGATIAAVPGQPVLVIRASEKVHAEIAAMLLQIDKPKPTVAEAAPVQLAQKVYALSYARAVDLAKVLADALAAKGTAAQTAQPGQQAPQGPAATVVADARTNTLIVTGTQEQLALVDRLIPTLDKPARQVQLQVRVQSVDSTVVRNLGIKWDTLGFGSLTGSFLESGLKLIFDATRSLAGLNIRATLDALETQNLARRISDANLLIEDNYGSDTSDLRSANAKAAELKAGGKLLIDAGPTLGIREFDIGLTIRLRPQITADGQILLEVYTQTGDDPINISANKTLVQIKSTLSKLRLKDGQTVVLGGLVEKQTKNVESKIPFLGDIPLIGLLFKQTSTEYKDSELIVVITANIVKE